MNTTTVSEASTDIDAYLALAALPHRRVYKQKMKKLYFIMKQILPCFIYYIIFSSAAFALTDAEYKEMLNSSYTYRMLDMELGDVWRLTYKSHADGLLKKALLENQRKWVNQYRDEEASRLISSGISKIDAYSIVTLERTDFLKIKYASSQFSKGLPVENKYYLLYPYYHGMPFEDAILHAPMTQSDRFAFKGFDCYFIKNMKYANIGCELYSIFHNNKLSSLILTFDKCTSSTFKELFKDILQRKFIPIYAVTKKSKYDLLIKYEKERFVKDKIIGEMFANYNNYHSKDFFTIIMSNSRFVDLYLSNYNQEEIGIESFIHSPYLPIDTAIILRSLGQSIELIFGDKFDVYLNYRFYTEFQQKQFSGNSAIYQYKEPVSEVSTNSTKREMQKMAEKEAAKLKDHENIVNNLLN